MKVVPLLIAAALATFAALRFRRLSRTHLAAFALLVAGFVTYGLGVVKLPNLEKLLEDVGKTLGPWTYLLVGVLAFLETGAFVGLLAPGETAILVGGLVAGQGRIDVVLLIVIVWICAVAGDVTSFLLGRRLGRDFMLRHGPRVKITPERLETVEAFFDRHGGKAIFLGRFVGLVRAIAPFLAGSSRIPLRRFLPYDILGAGVWGTTFVLLGYIFWRSFDQVAKIASKGAFALGTTIAVVAGGVWLYRWLSVVENRQAATAWLDERPLLRPLLVGGRRLRRPAGFVRDRLTPGELGLEVTTLVAIVAVGLTTYLVLNNFLDQHLLTTSDRRALSIVDGLRSTAVVDVLKVVTGLGALAVVAPATAIAAGLLAWRGRRLEPIVLGVGLALTVLLVHVAKDDVARPRPVRSLVGTDGFSFPSGHAAYAVAWVAIAVALARGVPRVSERFAIVTGAVVVAIVVGLIRVYLRAHFLSDVLAGWGLAAALFAICALAGLFVEYMRQNRGPA